MKPEFQPQTPFPPEVQSHAPSAAPETSAQKQSTNCTNSTNSSISEIREISGCFQKTIGEIREISGPAPKISVIVPVYKVEKYLPECIESVLAQTFTDFELILVDDGSPDNCGAICDAYAARDPRIRVFHKENGGVSSARNLGLDHARGEWIAFVDSDDTVLSVEWEKILYLASKTQSPDIITSSMVGVRLLPPAGKIPLTQWISEGGWEQVSFFLCFFKRALVNEKELRFHTGVNYSEDRAFLFQYLCTCKMVFSSGISFYCYRKRGDSAMSLARSRIDEFLQDHMVMTTRLILYCSGKDVPAVLRAKIFTFMMPVFYNCGRQRGLSDESIKNWLKSLRFKKDELSYVSFPRKMLLLIGQASVFPLKLYSRYWVGKEKND